MAVALFLRAQFKGPTRHVITMPCGAPDTGLPTGVNRPWATWMSAPRPYMLEQFV